MLRPAVRHCARWQSPPSKEFPNCITDGIFILNEPDIRPGDDIRPVVGLDDHVVEFEITPNRSDCLSMIGLAREAAVTFDKELKLHKPVVKGGAGSITDLADVDVEATDLCLRYTARMVKNVKIAPSPNGCASASPMGMRPINNWWISPLPSDEYGQPCTPLIFPVQAEISSSARPRNECCRPGRKTRKPPPQLCICDETSPSRGRLHGRR